MRLNSVESAKLQVQLGQRLALEKQTCFEAGRIWRSYVKEAFGLSRERADELIRIGVGICTVDESREVKKKRQQLSRRQQSSTNSAIGRFQRHAGISMAECNRALQSVIEQDLELDEIIVMRKIVVDAIFEWQKLFDVLNIT